MIILDTDALGHIQKKDPVGVLIEAAIDSSPDRDIWITSVTAYEMMSGGLTLIDRRKRERRDPIPAFRLFQDLVEYPGLWRGRILPYDPHAEQIFKAFTSRLRQELKDDARIAAVALAYGAGVWTSNVSDFSRVPGLAVYQADTGLQVS